MGVVHTGYLEKSSEELVVAVATLEVHVHGFEISSSKVNSTCFNRNRARIEGDFMLHGHRPTFKLTCFNFIDLSTPLVPLKRVKSLDPGSSETVLSVKINSEIRLD